MSQEPTETSPYKKLLGRGTYGEVYLIDTSDESTEGETEKPPSPSLDNFRYVKKYIHKYTKVDKDDIILEQTSIREIAIHRILSRYNNPYLLSFYSLKNKTSKYRLKFKYKGIPLDEWCKKNNAVIIDMSLVIETDLGDINERDENGKKNYRPENALRIRLKKITQGKNLGYVRVISDYDFQNDINLDQAHLVYIYKK